MGRRGSNATSYAFCEDLDHLKVSPEAEPPAIYKRLDKQTHLPVEQRTYQIRIPIPREKKGVRKSLRTADRSIALERAMEQVLETKLVLKQGGSVVAMPVEQVVEKFLAMKQARVRGRWEGKGEAGTKTVCKNFDVSIHFLLERCFQCELLRATGCVVHESRCYKSFIT